MNEIARYLVWVIVALAVLLGAAHLSRRHAGPTSDVDAETLLALFADPDPQVRVNAQIKIMSQRPRLVLVLAKIVNGDNVIARKEAAMALCMPKFPGRAVALPGLIRMLREDDLASQRIAIETLTSIGPDAAPAIPELLSILRTQQRSPAGFVPPCSYVPQALRQIQSGEAVPFLMDALVYSHTRVEVIEALGDLGAHASPALEVLERIRMKESGETCKAADLAIERIREEIANKK